MARIRTIKPSFFKSLTLSQLPLSARLTFAGLWCMADDEGRLQYDPRLVKSELWPLDDNMTAADVAADVRALTEASLITHYVVTMGSNDREILAVNGWREHQKINRPTPSQLPPPNQGKTPSQTPFSEDSVSNHGGLTGGKEGKGREGNKEGSTSSPAAPSKEFEAFWDRYPRKVGKQECMKVFERAAKKVGADVIIAGAERLARDPNLPEKQYIPHPKSWLNAGRWDDEPLPPRLGVTNRSVDRMRANLDSLEGVPWMEQVDPFEQKALGA